MNELLDQLSAIVLVVRSSDHTIRYLNTAGRVALAGSLKDKTFSFDEQSLSFEELFSDVCLKRLLKRFKRGRISEFICEIEIDGEQKPVRFGFSTLADGDFLLEGSDHTAVRETELMLKSYSEVIEKKNKLIQREQRKVERLLFNTLPKTCVNELRESGKTKPERFEQVSVLFLDFVGFTQMSSRMSTDVLFQELNDIFTHLDTIITHHQCERIKTIGDAYLAVCGMPTRVGDHASLLTLAAYRIREYVRRRNENSPYTWRCRIGIHTGEVTGGIVGRLKYIYDVFGDGVNTASRMESHSEPMKINLSQSTRDLLSEHFIVDPRGLIEVKGKGEMAMYYLTDIVGAPCSDRLKVRETLSAEDSISEEFMADFTPYRDLFGSSEEDSTEEG